jgi:hypothetical protein
MGFLQIVSDFMNAHLAPTVGVATVILGFVFDLCLRIFKTNKPLSIAWYIHDIANSISAFSVKISEITKNVAEFLDKVLPQRVIEAPVVNPNDTKPTV